MNKQPINLSDRFRKVLDLIAHRGLGEVPDREWAVEAFNWLYDQGDRPGSDDIVFYLHEKGKGNDVAFKVDNLWEAVADLRTLQDGERMRRFDPKGL